MHRGKGLRRAVAIGAASATAGLLATTAAWAAKVPCSGSPCPVGVTSIADAAGPKDIALLSGSMFVRDTSPTQIARFDATDQRVASWPVAQPAALAAGGDGNLYLATSDGRVVVYDQTGAIVRTLTLSTGGQVPQSIAVDAGSGTIYVGVSDYSTGHIQAYAPDGTFVREWWLPDVPTALDVDDAGTVWVAAWETDGGQGSRLAAATSPRLRSPIGRPRPRRRNRVQGFRAVTTAALAVATIAVAAGPAHAAGMGAGTGPSTFHLEDLVSGASGDPRVMMLDDQSALVAFDTFAGSPSGQIRVCKVGPVPAAACAAPGPIMTPGFSGASKLAIHPGLTPGTIYLTNGTANETELYTSTDGGTTFGGPVRISTYVNAQDFLVLPDGNLALVGTGNIDPYLATHFAIVPPSGAGLTTSGFYIPGDVTQRGIAYNGGHYVILGGGFTSTGSTDTAVHYAVYNGAGDPNSQANWATGTLAMNFDDPPNIAEGGGGVIAVGTVDGKVQVSKLTGTTFGAPVTIADKAGTAYLPNVTADASGRYTATWQVNSVGLRMATSHDGVHWSTPVTINSDRQFQTDTARTAAGNGLAVTRASGFYMATRLYGAVDLTLKASPTKVKKGKKSTLTATLHDEGGAGISGQTITFKAGSKSIGTGTTNGSGQATLKVKPAKTTKYTAAFAGSATLASYSSSSATVKVSK